MTSNAPRAPIDLDAIERDLKPGQAATRAASAKAATAKSDPLSELARIVGQDDPFRALLEARGAGAAPAGQAKAARVEPSLYDAPPAAYAQGPHANSHPEAVPADAFDQYLASVEQVHRGQDEGQFQDPAAFDDGAAYRDAKPARAVKRKTLMRVGAGVGVLALCVTGALAWNATRSIGGDGGPVTVLADKSPLKVAPETADGVEIPDQNKQIYDRNAKDGQIKVVNREEQPIDVNQATRSVAAEGASQGGATPGGTGMLTESLGEPRRIRTVAVRPDAPPSGMQAQREQVAAAMPISPVPALQMPEPSSPPPAAEPPRRAATRSLTPTPAPAASSVAETPAAETAAPSRRPQQITAAAMPESTASTGEPAATEAPALIGGFAVQIGVQSSEADARAAFRKAQAKYSQLAGKPELIRQAEVNGKAIYRVRVGPFGKSEANSLCSALKGAGGACFVAAN